MSTSGTNSHDPLPAMLLAARDGDVRALNAMLAMLMRLCYGHARRILGRGFAHHAEDACQSGLLAMALHLDNIQDPSPLGYALRCVRHEALRVLRREARFARLTSKIVDGQSTIAPSYADPLLRQAIIDAMRTLGDKTSDALARRVVGESHDEIAEAQQVSWVTAHNRLVRGKAAFADALQGRLTPRHTMFGAGRTPRDVLLARNRRRPKESDEK